MQLDWLLNPITLYSASAVCLVTSLAVVVRAKLHAAPQENLSIVPETVSQPDDSEIRGLKLEMEQMRESVCRLEESLPVRASGNGLNPTKRAVALRMHRRGEAVTSISAALETPSNEIALLLKLHPLTESKAS